MLCKFCGSDPDLVMMVPARGKFDGAIEVIACRGCAIKNGLYCIKHEGPCTGFSGDMSVACLRCIEEEVQEKRARAQEIYQQLQEGLPAAEWEHLREDMEIASAIIGDGETMALLRFVATKAHRLSVPIEEVVSRILKEQSVELILSRSIFF